MDEHAHGEGNELSPDDDVFLQQAEGDEKETEGDASERVARNMASQMLTGRLAPILDFEEVEEDEEEDYGVGDITSYSSVDWERFSAWVTCVAVVTFDLEVGQDVEYMVPSQEVFPEVVVKNIKDLAFPDNNSGYVGDLSFSFRVKNHGPKEFAHNGTGRPVASQKSRGKAEQAHAKGSHSSRQPGTSAGGRKPSTSSSERQAVQRNPGRHSPKRSDSSEPTAHSSTLFARHGVFTNPLAADEELLSMTATPGSHRFTATGTCDACRRLREVQGTANTVCDACYCKQAEKVNPAFNISRWKYLYGYVYFRQVPDATTARGYFQKSIVVITPRPLYSLYKHVASVIAKSYFSTGRASIDAACSDISKWPAPHKAMKGTLSLLTSEFEVLLPEELSIVSCLYAQPGIASICRTTRAQRALDLYCSLEPLLKDMQLLWELVITASPIIVYSKTPDVCSRTVLALITLISPLEYCGDFRPFFTIYDPDCRRYAKKSGESDGAVIGVTNPYFFQAYKHWKTAVHMPQERGFINFNNSAPSGGRRGKTRKSGGKLRPASTSSSSLTSPRAPARRQMQKHQMQQEVLGHTSPASRTASSRNDAGMEARAQLPTALHLPRSQSSEPRLDSGAAQRKTADTGSLHSGHELEKDAMSAPVHHQPPALHTSTSSVALSSPTANEAHSDLDTTRRSSNSSIGPTTTTTTTTTTIVRGDGAVGSHVQKHSSGHKHDSISQQVLGRRREAPHDEFGGDISNGLHAYAHADDVSRSRSSSNTPSTAPRKNAYFRSFSEIPPSHASSYGGEGEGERSSSRGSGNSLLAEQHLTGSGVGRHRDPMEQVFDGNRIITPQQHRLHSHQRNHSDSSAALHNSSDRRSDSGEPVDDLSRSAATISGGFQGARKKMLDATEGMIPSVAVRLAASPKQRKKQHATGVVTSESAYLDADHQLIKRFLALPQTTGREIVAAGKLLEASLSSLTTAFLIPLEQYFARLMPLRSTISPFKSIPRVGDFVPQQFLKSVQESLPLLKRARNGNWLGLYAKFLKSKNFRGWWAQKLATANKHIFRMYLEVLVSGRRTLADWAKASAEVEVIDVLLRIKGALETSGQAVDPELLSEVLETASCMIDTLHADTRESMLIKVREAAGRSMEPSRHQKRRVAAF